MGVLPDEGMWNFEGRERLERLLTETGLEADDICLVGSISLSARGLREHDDLDFCVRSALRDRIDEDELDTFLSVVDQRYENIDLSDDELIDDSQYHDVIDGFKVVRPEISFSYKKLRDLPKDEQDVELLKNYAVDTDDWDWDLYRSDYSQRPNSLLSRGVQSLRSDGLRITVSKVAGLLTRKFPVIEQVQELIPVYDFRTPWDALGDRHREISVAALLNRQYAGATFARYDTVAYWAALEAFAAGNDPEFDVEKLDVDRETLKKYVESSVEPNEPLAVSLKHRVLDPLRLAQHIHEGHRTVQVAPTFGREITCDDTWLQERGFSDKERKVLEAARLDLLESVGGLFYSIFWPTTHDYFDEMESSLSKKVLVRDSIDIEVEDIEEFVKDIYDAQTDHAPTWAIDWKADQMKKFPPVVRVVKIELPNPRLQDGISREIEMIKNDVRHEFVEHFPDTFYLSLLHATDSFEDNIKTKHTLNSHQ